MMAQFSNSNGGMTRSFSTFHGGRGRRSRVPAHQGIRFPAGANVAQAFGHDVTGMGKISYPSGGPHQVSSVYYLPTGLASRLTAAKFGCFLKCAAGGFEALVIECFLIQDSPVFATAYKLAAGRPVPPNRFAHCPL
jgi:hypothetical protein